MTGVPSQSPRPTIISTIDEAEDREEAGFFRPPAGSTDGLGRENVFASFMNPDFTDKMPVDYNNHVEL